MQSKNLISKELKKVKSITFSKHLVYKIIRAVKNCSGLEKSGKIKSRKNTIRV
jgi:hypothetical protein